MQLELLSESSTSLAHRQPWPMNANRRETEKGEALKQALSELALTKRELQIEAALERVRSRAMNMHHSFELSDVLSVLFEQYDILGICPVFSHLTLFDMANNKFAFRTTGRGGQRVQAEQIIDVNAIDAWKESVENWKKGGPNQVNSHVYPKEILPQVFNLFEEILSAIPEEAKFYPEDFPNGLYITQGYHKFGYVGLGHNREATAEEKEVVRRMAIEFERLYHRFIDLQQTEAQIREAQIEASLERVRAAAMAMRSSDDVGNATGVLFNELDKLGVPLLRCGLYIVDEKEKSMQVWRATATADGTIGQVAGTTSMLFHPMLEGAYNSWRRKETYYCYTLEGDDLRNYYASLSKNAPQFTQNVSTEKQIANSFFFNEGALFIFSADPLDAETSAMLKRLAAVFGLTYRRYLDLKIAEAQVKETIKQASLDRIRAEIASMRTTADLERITPLIWNELTTLGIPFIRCGVFIMDDPQQIVHTYLSTPEGKAIAAFQLPYNTPGNIPQVILHWKQKKLFTEHWDETIYAQFSSYLVEQGMIASTDPYFKTFPAGGFYLHLVPFLQGMLYVGNTTWLKQEDINVIQSIADSFSTAYARYEDFNQLETAKKNAEKTLLELKQAQRQLIEAEKMASLGQLTAGIAHEIQNPLNFVNNFSDTNKELVDELLRELALGNMQEAVAIAGNIKDNEEKVSRHGKRAESIVKSMLQHARAATGSKEPTSINKLVTEYLQLSYQEARAKDYSLEVKLETCLDNSIPLIDVIPQDMGRVLLNLFNNAFYAVAERKKQSPNSFEPVISVTTAKEKDGVTITIRDNGIGMSPEIAANIFQPFFTTKPTGEGTGLGLSLSYDIVTKAHSGRISVTSTEEEGSAFTVWLPA